MRREKGKAGERGQVSRAKMVFHLARSYQELLTPSLTHHLRGHSASLRVEISWGFRILLARQLTLTYASQVLLARTVLWLPPFLPHEGGFPAWLRWNQHDNIGRTFESEIWNLSPAQHKLEALRMHLCHRSSWTGVVANFWLSAKDFEGILISWQIDNYWRMTYMAVGMVVVKSSDINLPLGLNLRCHCSQVIPIWCKRTATVCCRSCTKRQSSVVLWNMVAMVA